MKCFFWYKLNNYLQEETKIQPPKGTNAAQGKINKYCHMMSNLLVTTKLHRVTMRPLAPQVQSNSSKNILVTNVWGLF